MQKDAPPNDLIETRFSTLEVTSVTKIGKFFNCKALTSRDDVFSVFYGVLNENRPFNKYF